MPDDDSCPNRSTFTTLQVPRLRDEYIPEDDRRPKTFHCSAIIYLSVQTISNQLPMYYELLLLFLLKLPDL